MIESKRVFFLKRAGIITGPFTMTKLKLMVGGGTLAGKDLFSTDKTDWRPVSRLFPETFPEAEAETGPAAPEPHAPESQDAASLPLPAPMPVPVPAPAPAEEKASERISPWLRDLAALIVLPWEFAAEAPLMRTKNWKLTVEASILNLLPCALLLGLSCRQYAFRLAWPWAPLYAAGVLLAVGLVSAVTALIIARFRLSPGSALPGEWKLLGIAFFMNYGALCGTFMTFYPCFRNPGRSLAGALLSAMAILTAGCAATLLTGDFLERFRSVPAKWAFLIVPLLTAGMAGMICFLIELIRN